MRATKGWPGSDTWGPLALGAPRSSDSEGSALTEQDPVTTFYRAEQSVLRPGGPRTTTGSRTRATLARREVPEDLGQNLFPGAQRPEPSREGGAPLGSEARG